MTAQVLIISDHLNDDPDLLAAVRGRAAQSAASFRLVVTNPARAEFHVLHADRHDAVERAQEALEQLLVRLREASGSAVTGKVSIRHDAFEAVEEDLHAHPADEVLVAVTEHELSRRLHHDLQHRLARFFGSVTPVGHALTP